MPERDTRSGPRRGRRSVKTLPVGKVPFEQLTNLLRGIGDADDVILGPAFGEDAAILRVERSRILVASDPITFATDRVGWYAVHVNANDVAAGGGEPRWFLAVLLVPENSPRSELTRIFRDVRLACSEVGAILVGGHTEVTAGIERPMVVGTMIGEVAGSHPIRTGTARPNDRLVLTKGVAVEGTAILAREFREDSQALLGERAYAAARRFLKRPGLSVLTEARIAREIPGVHAMHDLTEGGVVAGVLEMAQASGLGVELELDKVPVFPPCAQLCKHFGIDPLRTIASGSLLVAVSATDRSRLLEELELAGIDATDVGRITMKPELVSVRDGHEDDLTPPERDEIALLFDGTSAVGRGDAPASAPGKGHAPQARRNRGRRTP